VSNTDSYIRRIVYGAAGAVAAFAFFTSYIHIYDLGRANGQHGAAAKLLPLSVDLLIVAASLVMYSQGRAGVELDRLTRGLPRFLLWGGIAATVAANVASGLPYGPVGAVIAAWPGAVFAGVVEMVMVTVRPQRREAINQTVIPAGQPPVPATAHDAAAAAYGASVAGGNRLTEYQLHKRYGIARSAARKICAPPAPTDPAVAAAPPQDAPPPRPATAALNGSATHG
jgi:hypothetical protein